MFTNRYICMCMNACTFTNSTYACVYTCDPCMSMSLRVSLAPTDSFQHLCKGHGDVEVGRVAKPEGESKRGTNGDHRSEVEGGSHAGL